VSGAALRVDLDRIGGYGAFFRDGAAGRLPAALDLLVRPEQAGRVLETLDARPPFPLAPDLAAALRVEHRRLGAGPAALDALGALERGEAGVVLTGQQPGLLGGPLYTLYKVATAVAFAADLARRTGRPMVPVLWNAADDADFDEVAHGTLARGDGKLLRFALDPSARVPRGWVGDIPAAAILSALAPVRQAGFPEPSLDRLLGALERSAAAGLDFGHLHAARFLEWFRDRPLIVVDARLPELRRAAAPLFARYLDRAGAVRTALEASAAAMMAAGYEPPIGPEAAACALFLTPERVRLKLAPDEALGEARRLVGTHPSQLSPNVVLRPLVNDVALPTVAHVVGPAELQYLTQLQPVYRELGVPPAIVLDRATMTLVPRVAAIVADTLPGGAAELVADPSEAVRRWFDGRVPAPLRDALAAAHQGIDAVYDGLRDPARAVDASLPQLLDSAREKSLFQVDRVAEGVAKKVRQREESLHHGLSSLAEFLKPRGRLQERELSCEAPFLLDDTLAARLHAAAAVHVAAAHDGRREHALVSIDG
jgi:bacillithiol biosynthesis cysteine-adding enzyme BshC